MLVLLLACGGGKAAGAGGRSPFDNRGVDLLLCNVQGELAAKGTWQEATPGSDAREYVYECVLAGGRLFADATVNEQGAVTVTPRRGTGGLAVRAGMRYGVLPSRHVDDFVYMPGDHAPTAQLSVPAENLFVGLVGEGDRTVVLAWPNGSQHVTLARDDREGDGAGFAWVRILTDGTPVHIGVFDAEGIWHEADLRQSPFDKDLPLDWRPPYEAVWSTRLVVKDTITTYHFSKGRKKRWTPTTSYHVTPVYFENGRPFVHLSSKVSPTDRTIIYAGEGHAKTPYGFLAQQLSKEERAGFFECRRYISFNSGFPGVAHSGWQPGCVGRNRIRATLYMVGGQCRERDMLRLNAQERVERARPVEALNQDWGDFIRSIGQDIAAGARDAAGDPVRAAFFKRMGKHHRELDATFRKEMSGRTADENMAFYEEVRDRLIDVYGQAGTERSLDADYCLHQINIPFNRQESLNSKCGWIARRWFRDAAEACATEPGLVAATTRFRDRIRRKLERRCYASMAEPMVDLR